MNRTTANTQTELLELCKKGDHSAFKQLYQKYCRAMLNISMRIVNRVEEAEDILQESFIKAYQSIKKFENEAAFAGWLKRVVVNASIDLVRKRKQQFLNIDEVPLADTKVEEQVEESMNYDIETVKSAVKELPDGYRVVLTLFLFEDFSHREIGEMLKISEGTSKSQYMRAKQKLVQIIQQKTTITHERQA